MTRRKWDWDNVVCDPLSFLSSLEEEGSHSGVGEAWKQPCEAAKVVNNKLSLASSPESSGPSSRPLAERAALSDEDVYSQQDSTFEYVNIGESNAQLKRATFEAQDDAEHR